MTDRNPNIVPGPSGLTRTQIRDLATETHKHCSRCGRFKHKEDFHKSSPRNLLGTSPACKTCTNSYQSSWVKANKDRVYEKQRLNKIRRAYGERGLELDEARQNGAGCEVCGSTVNVHIDHCHTSNLIRGLLCHGCNTALGLLGEDDERILSLLEYMLRHHEIAQKHLQGHVYPDVVRRIEGLRRFVVDTSSEHPNDERGAK